jgi:hypothetical protein
MFCSSVSYIYFFSIKEGLYYLGKTKLQSFMMKSATHAGASSHLASEKFILPS